MMKGHVLALIVARPGRMRDGLRALLRAIPQIEMVDQADDGPSALRMVTEHHPTLLLLDSDLPGDEVPTQLGRIKAKEPQIRCIVLANNPQQQQVANAAGADSVLLKGFPAAKLFETIERLLPRQEKCKEHE